MAEIEFVGFVNEVDNSGKRMKTVENHRKKGNDGSYYTASRTYRTVKPGYESGLLFNNIPENAMVKVTGRELTEEWEYNDKKYKDLVVLATTVEIMKPGNNSVDKPTKVAHTTDLAIDLEAPF